MPTKTWISGNYNTTANWSPTGVPSSSDDILITTSSVAAYTFNGTPVFRNFTNYSANASFAGTVAIAMSGTFISTQTSVWTHSGVITWTGNASTTTNTIVANNITFNGGMVIDGSGITFRLGSNVTILDTKSVTLKNGYIDLVTYTLTCGFFISTYTTGYGNRGIYFTANSPTAALSLSWSGANKTVFDLTSGTSFSYTGQSLVILSGDSSGTRSIAVPIYGQNNYPLTFRISGSDVLSINNNAALGTFDFTDFSGTLKNNMRYVHGNYAQGSATIQGGGTGAATVFTSNTTQFPSSVPKTVDFGGNTSPTLYFTSGTYTVTGDLTGVYTDIALTTYGKIFFNGARQVDIYSAIDCLSVSHTAGRVNLYGTFNLYQTASTSTSPAYLLSGLGAQLYLDGAAVIDAITNGNGYIVVNLNGTGLFFDPTISSTYPQISCYMLTYTTSTSDGISLSGPAGSDNRGLYEIQLAIDSTNSNAVSVWNMPSGINYKSTGTINVYYPTATFNNSGTYYGSLLVQNACPNIGFSFATSKNINLSNSVMSSLDLSAYQGQLDLSNANLSIYGDFIGAITTTSVFSNTYANPIWTMRGNSHVNTLGTVAPSLFDTGEQVYPVILKFQSTGEGYITAGTKYESPNPLYLNSGTIDISSYAVSFCEKFIVPSVILDSGNSTRTFIHDNAGSVFYLTADSGVVWSSSTGTGLSVQSPDPGTTIYLNNAIASGTRTVIPGFWEESNSFSMVVTTSTDNIYITGPTALTEFIMQSSGTVDFSDITVYGLFQGTAVSGTSTVRMLGSSNVGVSQITRDYDGFISGHNNGPINSNVFAGSDALSATSFAVIGSDILQNLTVNRSVVTFQVTTATIGGNLTVTSTAVTYYDPSTSFTLDDTRSSLIIGGNIYFSSSTYVDVTLPPKLIINRNATTTSTFEVGQRPFLDTQIIFNNTSGTGTLQILDNTNATITNYNPYNLYPGFFDIIASTASNNAYIAFQANRTFTLRTDNTFANITKLSSTTSGTQHQLIYYDPYTYGHYGTKLGAITINTSTYIQDSAVDLNYMVFAGKDRNLGNNTGWSFGSISTVDPSFFYLD